ncbi:MAG TPA: porin [Gammaproteobacteria bacterium]|nr:porin [Gammaproteobacteria bacterium]
MSNRLFWAVAFACGVAGAEAAAAPGETTVGGKGYIDLSHIAQTSDGATVDPTGTSVDAKRFYVTIAHRFDETWSANITTDFNYVGNDNQTQLFVKKAYLQGSFGDAFTVRLGSADLPWIPFVEDLYGYRYVENILVERARFETSADWGLHALGEVLNGKINYAVAAINGNGYKNPSRSSSMDFTGRIGFVPIEGLRLAAGFRSGKRGLENENVDPLHTAKRYELLAAYVNPKLRVGAEYFETKNWNQVLAPETDEADGYSVWGSINMRNDLAVFTRYDHVNPSKTLQPALESTYFNVGLAYSPRPKVDLALVYKQDKVENGSFTTTNGTIGGLREGKYDEIGLWAKLQF